MKAKFGDSTVDLWKISDEEPKDDWVKEAFENRKIFWSNGRNGSSSSLFQSSIDKAKSHKTIPNSGKLSNTKIALVVAAAFGNTFGMFGDYLLYDSRGETKYSVLTQKQVDKEVEFL